MAARDLVDASQSNRPETDVPMGIRPNTSGSNASALSPSASEGSGRPAVLDGSGHRSSVSPATAAASGSRESESTVSPSTAARMGIARGSELNNPKHNRLLEQAMDIVNGYAYVNASNTSTSDWLVDQVRSRSVSPSGRLVREGGAAETVTVSLSPGSTQMSSSSTQAASSSTQGTSSSTQGNSNSRRVSSSLAQSTSSSQQLRSSDSIQVSSSWNRSAVLDGSGHRSSVSPATAAASGSRESESTVSPSTAARMGIARGSELNNLNNPKHNRLLKHAKDDLMAARDVVNASQSNRPETDVFGAKQVAKAVDPMSLLSLEVNGQDVLPINASMSSPDVVKP